MPEVPPENDKITVRITREPGDPRLDEITRGLSETVRKSLTGAWGAAGLDDASKTLGALAIARGLDTEKLLPLGLAKGLDTEKRLRLGITAKTLGAYKLPPGIARGLGTYSLAEDARKKFGAVPPAPKWLEVARNVRVDRGAPFMPELEEFAAANKRIAQARVDARRAAVERETRMVEYLEIMAEALERSEERAVAAEARADDAEAREDERRRVGERREWAMFVMTFAAVVLALMALL